MDAQTTIEWRGAPRWLSLGVSAFYLLGAIPLVFGALTVGAVVSLFVGLVVGAATLTGNSKLPLGMSVLATVQAVGMLVSVLGGAALPRLALQVALLGWSASAAFALWNAHRVSAA